MIFREVIVDLQRQSFVDVYEMQTADRVVASGAFHRVLYHKKERL